MSHQNKKALQKQISVSKVGNSMIPGNPEKSNGSGRQAGRCIGVANTHPEAAISIGFQG